MKNVKIQKITENKRDFLPLLLLGDEQEDMIERYLDRGTLLALYDDGLRAVCVVTDEGDGIFEVKNLAVQPESQRQGYGRTMLRFAAYVCYSKWGGKRLLVGTGDSPRTIPFYKACGFRESYRVPDFFTENYDHPIYEDGVLLRDMVYLEMNF